MLLLIIELIEIFLGNRYFFHETVSFQGENITGDQGRRNIFYFWGAKTFTV
jgi:hypothetical protein